MPRGLGGKARASTVVRPRRRARGIGVVRREKEKGWEKFCSPCKGALKAITGEDGAVVETTSDSGGSGGALTTDGVGAPGGVEDVNLWQDRLNERRTQHQTGRKGEKKGPSPMTSSSRGGKARCMCCSNA
jgi:hypothetical protein